MADIYVAARSAVLYYDEERVRLVKDVTTVRAGHPLLDGRGELFKPLTVDYDTADGGESQETVESTADDEDASEDVDEDVDDNLPSGVTYLGGPWYDVAGEKVRGRDAAVERARAADDDDEGDDGE